MNVRGLIDLEVKYEVSDKTVSNDLRILHQFFDEDDVGDLLDEHFRIWLNEAYEKKIVEDVLLTIVGMKLIS